MIKTLLIVGLICTLIVCGTSCGAGGLDIRQRIDPHGDHNEGDGSNL